MTGITEKSLQELFTEIRRMSEPDNFRRHLMAEAFRVMPPYPPGPEIEPTIELPPVSELEVAKKILERHGFTVVPNNRIGVVESSHRFTYYDMHTIRDFDRLVESVMGSLAGQLGFKLHEVGALTKHDEVGVCDRIIGWSAAVILPEKK